MHTTFQQSRSNAFYQGFGQSVPRVALRKVTAFAKRPWVVDAPATDVGEDEPAFNTQLIAQGTLATYGAGLLALALGHEVFHVPNLGFGEGAALNADAILLGLVSAVPILLWSTILESLDDENPEVARLIQAGKKMTLTFFGAERKVWEALFASITLSLAAGVGEEIVYRGFLQTVLAGQLGTTAAILVTAAIFGYRHNVTPLYGIFSFFYAAYWGWLLAATGNIVVPITSHAVSDVFAFFLDHLLVTQMPRQQRLQLLETDFSADSTEG